MAIDLGLPQSSRPHHLPRSHFRPYPLISKVISHCLPIKCLVLSQFKHLRSDQVASSLLAAPCSLWPQQGQIRVTTVFFGGRLGGFISHGFGGLWGGAVNPDLSQEKYAKRSSSLPTYYLVYSYCGHALGIMSNHPYKFFPIFYGNKAKLDGPSLWYPYQSTSRCCSQRHSFGIIKSTCYQNHPKSINLGPRLPMVPGGLDCSSPLNLDPKKERGSPFLLGLHWPSGRRGRTMHLDAWGCMGDAWSMLGLAKKWGFP